MSVNAMKWAWDQTTGNHTDKAVLVALSDWASDHGKGYDLCWHAQETIAARVECSIKTVERALACLEANGFIRREKRSRHDGLGRTTDIIFLCTDREPARPLKSKAQILSGRANRQSVQATPNRQSDGLPPDKLSVNPPTNCLRNLKDRTCKEEPSLATEGVAGENVVHFEPAKSGQKVAQKVIDFPADGAKATGRKVRASGKPAYPADFEAFFSAYRQAADGMQGNKALALEAWSRLGQEDRLIALQAIPGYMANRRQTETKAQHAVRYLRHRSFDDFAPDADAEASNQIKAVAIDMFSKEWRLGKTWWPSLTDVPRKIYEAATDYMEANFREEAYA